MHELGENEKEVVKDTNEACKDSYGRPFPGFICPYMRIMAYYYNTWRDQVSILSIFHMYTFIVLEMKSITLISIL